MPAMMKAAVFVGPGRITLDERPVPDPGPNDAVIRVTTTTICETDLQILTGAYPVAPGLVVGHEPIGVIEKLGRNVVGYAEGQRVLAAAICPSGHSYAALDGLCTQDGPYTPHGLKPMGGWRFGNTIDGAQAEYLRVPDAMANLAPVPSGLTDEQVLMCPDIMSTGFAGAEHANIRVGDTVAIFAQGPVGLCAAAGARLRGATTVITVDSADRCLAVSRRIGADEAVNANDEDPVEAIMQVTGGRGVDAAIETLGLQSTFENCLKVLKPGGTLASLGIYGEDLTIPASTFHAGLGDHRIVTALCPGGKERMRRLMNVIASGRVDLGPLVTHRYRLDEIEDAYALYADQREGVLKVAVTP